MNRKDRRASREMTVLQAKRAIAHAEDNAYHWGEVKRIKRAYDALPDDEKLERKPALAAEIDEHLTALLAG